MSPERGPARSRWRGAGVEVVAVLLALLGLGACALRTAEVERRGGVVALSGGPTISAAYVLAVDGGAVVVDLGWDPAGQAIREALAALDADTGDVRAVLLTHSHQDHIAAWRSLRGAPFVLAAAEVPYLDGRRDHGGLVPSLVAPVWNYDRPEPGELTVVPFLEDTTLVFGRDTVRAYAVPGHTPGHAAYLIRGILYLGDALTYTPVLGFMHAKGSFSGDRDRSRESLRRLLQRVEADGARWFCTAHAKCGPVDDGFRQLLTGERAFVPAVDRSPERTGGTP